MTNHEAQTLAQQITGCTATTVIAFENYCDMNALSIAVDTETGDWVVLENNNAIARCA